jgi:hypothetical protein
LREICPRKKKTPKPCPVNGAVTGILLKDGKDDTAAASVKEEEEEEDKVVSISASVSVPVDKVSHVLP